jgi:hypothetical protein
MRLPRGPRLLILIPQLLFSSAAGALEVTVVDGSGGSFMASLEADGTSSPVSAAAAFADRHHLGTDSIPRLVTALAETAPEWGQESDAVLARLIATGQGDAAALAVRASIARGLPLADWRGLASSLDSAATGLRVAALAACAAAPREELRSTIKVRLKVQPNIHERYLVSAI